MEDKFEVSIENGYIKLEPAAVYPREYIFKLSEEIQVLRKDAKFEYNTFDNTEFYKILEVNARKLNWLTNIQKPKKYYNFRRNQYISNKFRNKIFNFFLK